MGRTVSKPVVLFLCTNNAVRSQMAEAFLKKRAADQFEVVSAGTEPKEIHPLTISHGWSGRLKTPLPSKGLRTNGSPGTASAGIRLTSASRLC
jgi:Low molecular weight phosphotyrosine protein phosphatase